MNPEYQRFHKEPRPKQPTPDCLDPSNFSLPQKIFNTFASVIDSPDASPFAKRLAQAGLVATPDDKILIIKTWPLFFDLKL